MANNVNAASFENTIAGIRLRTTYLYSKWITFDRMITYLVEGINRVGYDGEGLLTYQYTSGVKSTSPYRVLTCKPHHMPNQWLEITDVPHDERHDAFTLNGYVGLTRVTLENYHKFSEQPKLRYDREKGIMFEVHTPHGYRKR